MAQKKSAHVELAAQIETNEIYADDFGQDDDEKYDDVDPQSSNNLWNEVAMMKHGLVSKNGAHNIIYPDKAASSRINKNGEALTVKHVPNYTVRIPFDEVAMKRSGLVDEDAHHMTEADLLNRDEYNLENGRRMILGSSVDAMTISSGLSTTPPSMSPSSSELVTKYQEAMTSRPNLLKSLKITQEYREQRVGNGDAVVICWSNGMKNVYELNYSSVRHVGNFESDEYKYDLELNPWVQYEDESQHSGTDEEPSEHSPIPLQESKETQETSSQATEQRISAFRSLNESKPFTGIQPTRRQIAQLMSSKQAVNSDDDGIEISGKLQRIVDDGKGHVKKKTKILYFKDP